MLWGPAPFPPTAPGPTALHGQRYPQRGSRTGLADVMLGLAVFLLALATNPPAYVFTVLSLFKLMATLLAGVVALHLAAQHPHALTDSCF